MTHSRPILPYGIVYRASLLIGLAASIARLRRGHESAHALHAVLLRASLYRANRSLRPRAMAFLPGCARVLPSFRSCYWFACMTTLAPHMQALAAAGKLRRYAVVNDLAHWERSAQTLNLAAARLRGSTGCDSAPESREAAGLVPSKTSLQDCISFSPSVVAERRVKRLKKSVWASGHLHGIADNGFRPAQVWFVTLTYKGVGDWASKHISAAVQGFRNWCRDRGIACRYTWVAELQQRGAVHYHLLAWLPHGYKMPKWDRRTCTPSGKKMACWWPHGMTNVQIAKAGVGYLMKYLSKLGELTRFPKGLRLYGIGGLNAAGRGVRSWLNLPEWVKASHGVGEIKRVVRGFCEIATGVVLEPMFRVHHFPFGISLERLRPAPERFHDGAYSSVSFA